ncbi:MAG TPA: hypothetical protein VFV99_20075 [Kofleriaceae bacterium]|nr:hypothetical protein [Kofleriaceae bacterium]
MTEIEPPSDDLRALFASERDISAVERAAIRTKLGATLATPAAATTAVATTKLIWIAAAALATAAGIWWLVHRAEPAAVPRAPTIETGSAITPEPSIAITAPEPSVAAPKPSVAVAEQQAPQAAAPIPSQAELLAKAWQVLPHDPAEALKLVELDARLHADGALTEEREALRIQALLPLGRAADARELAKTFNERYPQSVHRKRLDAALGGHK